MMSKFLYFIGNFCYTKAIYIASMWNKKAKLWVNGRKNWESQIVDFCNKNSKKIVWMHCASLGEFEQGRPVLEKLKATYPNYSFILTFFSPSGYSIQKNNKEVDGVFYLPVNNAKNASLFIQHLQPVLVVWVKYDYWDNFLFELKKQKIPVVLISAKFNINQPFFKFYGTYWITILHCFSHIFVQDKNSIDLLKSIAINHCTIGGDTRFDRVIEIAKNRISHNKIELFCTTKNVIVAGSTWLEDEEEICHFANKNKNIKFIIAPHHIDESRLLEVEKLFKHTIRYAQLKNETDCNVLIIDNIGMLSSLYQYATIAYIGGGFGGDGVHNVLEPAAYGKPILYGPTYEKYTEAIDLVEMEAAYSIENAIEFEEVCIELLEDKILQKITGEKAKKYVQDNIGSSNFIVNYISENRLLTKL
jgi:3-deoxy-D-manno-octulosonic-acid transferase